MWALRSVATAMLLAGVSVLVAGVPLLGMLPESPVARAIAGILFQLSGVFVVSGATAMYLSRPRAPWRPNERATTSDADRLGIGGWLIALAIVLVALPVWLLLRLQPFLAEWSRVVDFLAASDIWQGANANMSGVVLVPLASGDNLLAACADHVCEQCRRSRLDAYKSNRYRNDHEPFELSRLRVLCSGFQRCRHRLHGAEHLPPLLL